MPGLKHIGIGVLAAAGLLAAKVLFEKTDFGHSLEVKTFQTLQGTLPALSNGRLPVVVADISKVPGGKDAPTSRDTLKSLLEAVAAKQPRAIAIDIDFSPDARGWITPRDPEFFDYCLRLKQQRGIPIFLGVYRARAAGPHAWLGLPKYQELAAAGLASGADTRRVPRWIWSQSSQRQPLPTLGEALAATYRADPPEPGQWISWALERTNIEPAPHDPAAAGVQTLDVLVNYSKLQQLMSEHQVLSRPQTVEDIGELLKGRLVLLGDVASPMDTFNVPGERTPVPGVYLMAAAAYTMAFEPLFEFTHTARILLDVLISVVLFVGIGMVGEKHRGRFVLATIAGVLLFGLALVRFAGVLWLDFLLAPFAILLHPSVEAWLGERLGGTEEAAS